MCFKVIISKIFIQINVLFAVLQTGSQAASVSDAFSITQQWSVCQRAADGANATNTLVYKAAVFPVSVSAVRKQQSTVAEQTKKRSMTADTTEKISENPKKIKEI